MECNYFKTGNIEEFEYKLHAENNAVVEYLRETARQPVRPTREELKSLVIEYRSKLNNIKKKFIK
jgi:deoxycytidylate deaminase